MTDLLKSEQYIKSHRSETTEIMLRFAATDLLLFWSDNAEVYTRQLNVWQPFLNYFENESGTKIKISQSLEIPDNEQCFLWVKSRLNNLSDRELTAAFLTSALLKSVFLGLSVLNNKINADDIFNAAFLEDIYQNELWGIDKEAFNKREKVRKEISLVKDWLK
ncbi:MAG: hypothetical protein IJ532_01230 [Alphaproteobacteria bacterium]|nr:hypothetical protein [Alphaproteobacteria bacterium]